jgi:hypothetical protein
MEVPFPPGPSKTMGAPPAREVITEMDSLMPWAAAPTDIVGGAVEKETVDAAVETTLVDPLEF